MHVCMYVCGGCVSQWQSVLCLLMSEGATLSVCTVEDCCTECCH